MTIPLAVYVGAGLDLKIIKNIPEVENFVFIDSQPNSEFGLEENWHRDTNYIFNCICPRWAPLINGFSRPNFIPNLKKTAIEENMILISEEVNKKLTFQYNNQIIDYFVNISVPHHLPLIKNDIKNYDHLIVAGFFPHHYILNYTTKHITFWGNTNTIYNQNTENNCLCNNNDVDGGYLLLDFQFHSNKDIDLHFLQLNQNLLNPKNHKLMNIHKEEDRMIVHLKQNILIQTLKIIYCLY